MTAISPNFAPVQRADQLGSALQQGLPRPLNPKLSWTLLHTLIAGGLTGGIAPLLVLPGRFKDFVQSEQMQYWHLAEWMRLQGGGADAEAATAASQRLTSPVWLRAFGGIFTLIAIAIGMTALTAPRAVPVTHWQAWTGLIWPHAHDQKTRGELRRLRESIGPEMQFDGRDGFSSRGIIPTDLVLAFDLAIAGASLCLLGQINIQVARVKQFVAAFNQLSNRHGVGPIRPPGWHIGLRPAWLVAGGLMCTIGAYWAVPVMLAAGAQRSYIIRTTRRLRSDMARRQRDVLVSIRPAVQVPTSVYLLANCPQDNCRAPLPPEAAYCRRCGTKIPGRVA